jgi:hypothetical protein
MSRKARCALHAGSGTFVSSALNETRIASDLPIRMWSGDGVADGAAPEEPSASPRLTQVPLRGRATWRIVLVFVISTRA